jgi:hypothetical protein
MPKARSSKPSDLLTRAASSKSNGLMMDELNGIGRSLSGRYDDYMSCRRARARKRCTRSGAGPSRQQAANRRCAAWLPRVARSPIVAAGWSGSSCPVLLCGGCSQRESAPITACPRRSKSLCLHQIAAGSAPPASSSSRRFIASEQSCLISSGARNARCDISIDGFQGSSS